MDLPEEYRRGSGHRRRMGFLERLQSDLKHAVLEHQRVLVVQLLQRRFAELTLEDLRTLLASPLGRGLGSVRVADIVPAASSGPEHSAG